MTSTTTSSSSLPPKIVSSSSSTNDSLSSSLTKNSSSLSNNSLPTTINNHLVKMTTSSNSNERKQLFNNNFSPKKEIIDNSTNSNQSNVSNVSTNSTPLNGLPPPTSSNNGPNSSSSTSSSPHPLNTGLSNGTNGSNSDLGPSGLPPPGSTFPGLSPASAAEMMSRVAAASAGWPYNPTAVPPPGWPYNPATMAKSPFLLPPFLSLPPDQLAAMGQPLPGSTGPDAGPPPPGAIPGLPTGPMDMKDLEAAWSGLPYPPSAYYPYDGSLPGYFPNGCVSMYGMDLNGARRKNATRETTSTLKAWLSDHRKNPYPTKGEKIMLAIITKMTLTQVSTWFANARRRLKKENKMTWSPRNRCDDDDDDDRDDDRDGGNNSDPDTDQDRDDSHSLSGRRSTDSPSSTPAHHHQRHLTRVKRDEGDSEILDIEGDDEDDDHDSHNQNHHHHPSPLHPRMNRLFHHLGPIEKGKDTCVSPLCPCNQQHSHLLNSQHSKLFPNLSTTPNNNSIPNTSSLGGQGLQIPSSQHSQGVVPPNSHLPPPPPPPHPGSHPLMYCSPFATHSPMGNHHHPSSASHLLPGHQRTQVKRVWRVWEK